MRSEHYNDKNEEKMIVAIHQHFNERTSWKDLFEG